MGQIGCPILLVAQKTIMKFQFLESFKNPFIKEINELVCSCLELPIVVAYRAGHLWFAICCVWHANMLAQLRREHIRST